MALPWQLPQLAFELHGAGHECSFQHPHQRSRQAPNSYSFHNAVAYFANGAFDAVVHAAAVDGGWNDVVDNIVAAVASLQNCLTYEDFLSDVLKQQNDETLDVVDRPP